MKNKISFIICSIIVIISNLLMISPINNGVEVGSNIFIIVLTLFLLPIFFKAVDFKQTSFIRLESSALIVLSTLSIMRLINRIIPIPDIVNFLFIVIALGMGISLLAASFINIKNKK
ncbi:hypothetical protein [Streptococcus sp. DD10]|uniref:hypothetical protein n=1 Tax=Streptococcus sp. DD10 TaxID=1777878 RepID=UPI0009EE3EFC|nr:hypothetical protein [Streptococcus sp. DD10]